MFQEPRMVCLVFQRVYIACPKNQERNLLILPARLPAAVAGHAPTTERKELDGADGRSCGADMDGALAAQDTGGRDLRRGARGGRV